MLEKLILDNLENKTYEVKRLFHGRGNLYKEYSHITVDSIDEVLFVCFFEQKENEEELIFLFQRIYKESNTFSTLIIQRRYLEKQPCEAIEGNLQKEFVAIENDLKYKISFENRNLGLFFDMKKGREFVKQNSKNKKVLNLFSYTCAFSVCAIEGGAISVINMDMAKNMLNLGRANHILNNHDTKKVKFFAHNILKSWSKLKKEGPYDLIIIDPPSFQKGSFAASNDYLKIIKRLDSLASKQCIVLSCLNAPELDSNFIKNIFKEHAPSFKYEKRLENLKDFASLNEEKSLKNLVFKNF